MHVHTHTHTHRYATRFITVLSKRKNNDIHESEIFLEDDKLHFLCYLKCFFFFLIFVCLACSQSLVMSPKFFDDRPLLHRKKYSGT